MPELIATSEDTRIYEWCILYPYPMNQKEEVQLLKEIDELFAEAGAKQIAKDSWGRRGLAYPIKGSTEGVYVVYYFEMDPAKVKEVDSQLRIMKGVLRHIFVKPPKHFQIVKYSEKYEQWLKDRESAEDVKTREHEEKVNELVARKAKRAAKLVTERKKSAVQEPAAAKGEITEQIDKLISGDSIDNL